MAARLTIPARLPATRTRRTTRRTVANIQADWDNRELVEIVQLNLLTITKFLNDFDSATRYKLARVNEKLTRLERTLDSCEAAVRATLEDGTVAYGDVLVGADGIWSQVRAAMRDEPARGDGSGVAYSGYTVFAGELAYNSPDNGEVGYKVYIGPNQYFVITDIGGGRYQWYAFLARDEGSEASEPKPDGASPYLQKLFTGWSPEVIDILQATREDEIVFCALLIVAYFLHCVFIYERMEGWSLTTAAYYSFSTFSTVGLGDYVPLSDRKDRNVERLTWYHVWHVAAVVAGMALVSLLFTLLHERAMIAEKHFRESRDRADLRKLRQGLSLRRQDGDGVGADPVLVATRRLLAAAYCQCGEDWHEFFDAFDTNHDGHIEQAELVAAYEEAAESSCVICQDDYKEGDVLRELKCGTAVPHLFHVECIDRWLITCATKQRELSCPLCNTRV